MIEWLKKTVLKEGCISEEDFDIFKIVDTPQEVVKEIKKFYGKDKKNGKKR